MIFVASQGTASVGASPCGADTGQVREDHRFVMYADPVKGMATIVA